MLFLNLLSFEMHVLCVLGAGRHPLHASFLGLGRPRPGRGGRRAQLSVWGPDPLIQGHPMEIDFSYLSPEMNCFKLE